MNLGSYIKFPDDNTNPKPAETRLITDRLTDSRHRKLRDVRHYWKMAGKALSVFKFEIHAFRFIGNLFNLMDYFDSLIDK